VVIIGILSALLAILFVWIAVESVIRDGPFESVAQFIGYMGAVFFGSGAYAIIERVT
jgi:hypothetical protein